MLQFKIIAVLCVLLAFGAMAFTVQNLRHERDELKGDLKTVRLALDNTQRVNTAQREAILKTQQKERLQYDAQQKIRNQIHGSPDSDNAPAAPVLSRTLDSLRAYQGIH